MRSGGTTLHSSENFRSSSSSLLDGTPSGSVAAPSVNDIAGGALIAPPLVRTGSPVDPSALAGSVGHWAETAAPIHPHQPGSDASPGAVDARGEEDSRSKKVPGPFSVPLNHLLGSAFGTDLSGITLSRGEGARNTALKARAHTVGTHISLGERVTEDLQDGPGMEAIAHEVAHALAGGGSGQEAISRNSDPGELSAHETGRTFRRFMESGGKGPVPSLRPAFGGRARIHRLEGGEHVHSVDDAAEILKRRGRPNGGSVDADVESEMQEPIHLPNGLTVTPGEYSSLMGDFYGKFKVDANGKRMFDPSGSMDMMMRKDNRDEMEQILNHVREERRTGKAEPNLAYEKITEHRKKDNEPTFLDLASMNESHFSSDSAAGHDNNMSTYAWFHQKALEEAAKGDKADPNLMRAYEAGSMHYLVDRHSAGHAFDKVEVMEAWRKNHPYLSMVSDNILPNLAAKVVHDEWNSGGSDGKGIGVHNSTGKWQEYGDDHWDNPEDHDRNAESRRRTSESIYSSYGELNDVRNGKRSPQDAQKHYAVSDTVPQWDPGLERNAEDRTKDLGLGTLLGKLVNLDNIGILGHTVWGGAKDLGHKVWDGAKDLGHKVWDGAKDVGHTVWGGAKDLGHKVWDGAKDVGHTVWGGAKDLGHKAWDWLTR